MNARSAKLETLLARVLTRAAQPRSLALAPEPTAQQAAPVLEAALVVQPVPVEAPVPTATTKAVNDDHITNAASDAEPKTLPKSAAKHDERSESAPPLGEVEELDDLEELEMTELDLDEPQSLEIADEPESEIPPLSATLESVDPLTRKAESSRDVPTMSQLGETIHLEEGHSQEFELDEPALDEPYLETSDLAVSGTDSTAATSDLEASLPLSQPSDSLAPPQGAREELENLRLGDATPIEAHISTRPVLSTNVVDLISSSRTFEPQSFLELLDASLSL